MDSLTRLTPFLRGCLCCQSRHVLPDGPPGPTSSHPTGANHVSNVRSNATSCNGCRKWREIGAFTSRLAPSDFKSSRYIARSYLAGGVIVSPRTRISFRNSVLKLARNIQEKRDLDFPHSKPFARAKIKGDTKCINKPPRKC